MFLRSVFLPFIDRYHSFVLIERDRERFRREDETVSEHFKTAVTAVTALYGEGGDRAREKKAHKHCNCLSMQNHSTDDIDVFLMKFVNTQRQPSSPVVNFWNAFVDCMTMCQSNTGIYGQL